MASLASGGSLGLAGKLSQLQAALEVSKKQQDRQGTGGDFPTPSQPVPNPTRKRGPGGYQARDPLPCASRGQPSPAPPEPRSSQLTSAAPRQPTEAK